MINWLKWTLKRWHFYVLFLIWSAYGYIEELRLEGYVSLFNYSILAFFTLICTLIIYFVAYYFKIGWRVEHPKAS